MSELTDEQISARVAEIMGWTKSEARSWSPWTTPAPSDWGRYPLFFERPPNFTAPGAAFWRVWEWAVKNRMRPSIEQNGIGAEGGVLPVESPVEYLEQDPDNPRRAFCLALIAAVDK